MGSGRSEYVLLESTILTIACRYRGRTMASARGGKPALFPEWLAHSVARPGEKQARLLLPVQTGLPLDRRGPHCPPTRGIEMLTAVQ